LTRAGDHYLVIRRWGRSHRACCECGWTGHAWNDLRPAEADAWHHTYGDERIVDVAAISDPTVTATATGDVQVLGAVDTAPAGALRGPAVKVTSPAVPDADLTVADATPSGTVAGGPGSGGAHPSPSVETLVVKARALADSSAPHGRGTTDQLLQLAMNDRHLLQEASSQISELLRLHSRDSANTADSEWLQLLTARRLVQAALEKESVRSGLL